MTEGNGNGATLPEPEPAPAASPFGVELVIDIGMAEDTEARNQYVRELAAFALGNALIFRAAEHGVDPMATLDEVSDLLGGKVLDHAEASAMIAPVLDRLLGKVCP